jgi:glycine C-acetyltransferase
MYGQIKTDLTRELAEIKEAGLFKEERYIHSPQSADIQVEYPKGADRQEVVNFCANNYLGLSSHPEVIEADMDEVLEHQMAHTRTAVSLGRTPQSCLAEIMSVA